MNRVLWMVLKQITMWQSARQITAHEATEFLSLLEAAQGVSSTNGEKSRKGPGRPKKEEPAPLLPPVPPGSPADDDPEIVRLSH
jgi:hypothetical protein